MLFRKKKYINLEPKETREIKKELWQKCSQCGKLIYEGKLKENFKICPYCGNHFRFITNEWIALLTDNKFEPYDANLISGDPLDFEAVKSYKEKLKEEIKITGLKEALTYGLAKISNFDVILSILDSSFIMGSMGSVVGEKFVRGCEKAIEKKLPFISICGGGGGARMYEGMFSLMQMVKTSQAVGKLKENGVLYISVLTDPTMGGVAASFAFLGDIIIAEPKALIGFAGPRVIEQTIKQKLPQGFQRAEFLYKHGMIDEIISRDQLRDKLIKILSIFS